MTKTDILREAWRERLRVWVSRIYTREGQKSYAACVMGFDNAVKALSELDA